MQNFDNFSEISSKCIIPDLKFDQNFYKICYKKSQNVYNNYEFLVKFVMESIIITSGKNYENDLLNMVQDYQLTRN